MVTEMAGPHAMRGLEFMLTRSTAKARPSPGKWSAIAVFPVFPVVLADSDVVWASSPSPHTAHPVR